MGDRDDRRWDDGNRPSWSEIDKMRDRSRHVDHDRSGSGYRPSPARSRHASNVFKKEVERLLSGKKGGKAHDKLVLKMNEAAGTPKCVKLCDEYLKEYGLPQEWETLVLFLEHPDPEVVTKAIEGLRPLAPAQSEARRQIFRDQLQIIEMTAATPDLGSLVADALKEFA